LKSVVFPVFGLPMSTTVGWEVTLFLNTNRFQLAMLRLNALKGDTL
jgi:hypothetical protein